MLVVKVAKKFDIGITAEKVERMIEPKILWSIVEELMPNDMKWSKMLLSLNRFFKRRRTNLLYMNHLENNFLNKFIKHILKSKN